MAVVKTTLAKVRGIDNLRCSAIRPIFPTITYEELERRPTIIGGGKTAADIFLEKIAVPSLDVPFWIHPNTKHKTAPNLTVLIGPIIKNHQVITHLGFLWAKSSVIISQPKATNDFSKSVDSFGHLFTDFWYFRNCLLTLTSSVTLQTLLLDLIWQHCLAPQKGAWRPVPIMLLHVPRELELH